MQYIYLCDHLALVDLTVLLMPPKKRPAMIHITRTRIGKLSRRVVSIAAEQTSTATTSAAEAHPTLDAFVIRLHRRSDCGGGHVSPGAVGSPTASTISDSAVTTYAANDASRTSRIPVPTSSMPSTSTAISSQLPAPMPSSSAAVQAAPPLVSDDIDLDALVGDFLGGESHTPMPTYSVVKRPLGANLSDFLNSKIMKSDYVNLQHLLIDDDDALSVIRMISSSSSSSNSSSSSTSVLL